MKAGGCDAMLAKEEGRVEEVIFACTVNNESRMGGDAYK